MCKHNNRHKSTKKFIFYTQNDIPQYKSWCFMHLVYERGNWLSVLCRNIRQMLQQIFWQLPDKEILYQHFKQDSVTMHKTEQLM
jgi:hypothetical protein